jgi:uncharacterized protein (DUF1800 family)
MATLVQAAIAANRFGLGARPGEIPRIADDPRGALRAQLTGAAPLLDGAGLPEAADVLARAAQLRLERSTERRSAAPDPAADAGVDAGPNAGASGDARALRSALQKLPELYRPIYIDEAIARTRAAVSSERSLLERLVQFWSNHFAVSVDKIAVLGIAGAFEREAIRPHVLGSFHELLLAVERHPAMLLYLDNFQSAGPNSQLVRAVERRRFRAGTEPRKIGINENLAREILELHTLGVDGGYTQTDVTEFAKVLSGWSIGGGQGRLRGGETGRFYFREALHEPGARTLLGKSYAEDGAGQGIAVLQDLAHSQATARHLSTKLARHFIADEPPASAIERLSQVFIDSRGDLPSVYRALIELPAAWAEPLAKFKTPSDYIHSALRALDLPLPEGAKALAPFELLGQRQFSPGSPAGWPDRSADWDGPSAVLKRVEWANQVGQRLGSQLDAVQLAPQALGALLSEHTRSAVGHAESAAQALTLLLACPEFMRR